MINLLRCRFSTGSSSIKSSVLSAVQPTQSYLCFTTLSTSLFCQNCRDTVCMFICPKSLCDSLTCSSLYVGNVAVLQRPSSAGVAGAAAQVSYIVFHMLVCCSRLSSDDEDEDVICITSCNLHQRFIEINGSINNKRHVHCACR